MAMRNPAWLKPTNENSLYDSVQTQSSRSSKISYFQIDGSELEPVLMSVTITSANIRP